MIFIDLFGNPPSQELIDEGAELTRQLMALPPEKRSDFIDDHSDYWSKLKPYFMALSNGKCWYTEAKDISSIYHMDHFRPKKKTIALKKDCTIKTTNNTEGYWWLSFDWENYRLSSSIPNTTKGNYFPLMLSTSAATTKDEIGDEWPGLLDPTDATDVALIGFGDDGKVCPTCPDGTWDADRVKLSVRVYNLDNVTLTDARKEIQQTCKRLIQEIKKIQLDYAQTRSTTYRESYKERVRELRDMTKPTAELSAVARNYIKSQPEEFIRNIAI